MDINTLFEQARKGDKGAEKRLLESLSARFQLFARHRIWNESDREEVVQTALTVLLRSYKETEITVSFAAWAQRVLENKIIDFYRSERHRRNRFEQTEDFDTGFVSTEVDPELKQRLRDCLRKVNAVNRRHARILVLKYQGFSMEEICEKLDLTPNNSYSVLFRARAMLASCLKKGKV